jgi:hypothetical protein
MKVLYYDQKQKYNKTLGLAVLMIAKSFQTNAELGLRIKNDGENREQ